MTEMDFTMQSEACVFTLVGPLDFSDVENMCGI